LGAGRPPAPGDAPDQARNTRALAWAFVYDCWNKKEAAPTSRLDDVKEVKNDSRHTTSIHK
jgi:hypothetical protein